MFRVMYNIRLQGHDQCSCGNAYALAELTMILHIICIINICIVVNKVRYNLIIVHCNYTILNRKSCQKCNDIDDKLISVTEPYVADNNEQYIV